MNEAAMCEQFPDDDNGDVLRRMERNGDDFSKARDINFSVVFPDEFAASIFAEHFQRLGYRSSVKKSDCVPELPWDVTVTRYMLPTHQGITEFEETLELQALLGGGRNDGWGCFNQPRLH